MARRALDVGVMSTTFNDILIGERFRVSGYDDLFSKVSDYRARCLGHGWLKKPVKLARKGELINFSNLRENVNPA
jgi:hypothetical protein